jgi:hypothetical protein
MWIYIVTDYCLNAFEMPSRRICIIPDIEKKDRLWIWLHAYLATNGTKVSIYHANTGLTCKYMQGAMVFKRVNKRN